MNSHQPSPFLHIPLIDIQIKNNISQLRSEYINQPNSLNQPTLFNESEYKINKVYINPINKSLIDSLNIIKFFD